MGVIDASLVKMLRDFKIYCDRVISTRQPDITIINKAAKLITLIDISIPADKRVFDKEDEKIQCIKVQGPEI